MSTVTSSLEPTAGRAEGASTAAGEAPADLGLRSVQGIRWLLLVGGLVVAVSVIRLVAAEWGMLPIAARFLTLVTGALAVFVAGDFTRRRLHLPVAGSALLFLAAALVPLLAWGAADLRLLDSTAGWPCLIVGLGALLAATDRAMRGILAYRGRAYTLASGVMLFALPVLPYLEAHWTSERWFLSPEFFFLAAAVAFGLLLRVASQHINRFFFHRDRLSGSERPVHWLPFVLLVVLYGAGMSLLTAFSTHLAVPLIFIALALIDAGEEYYRALVRAAGSKPERWPRRSSALLALGFTAMVSALATAPLDVGHHSLALVASIASLRLLAWAWRYSSTVAHVVGLLVGIVAYHASPAFIPEVARDLFDAVTRALGIDDRGPGALSLGDLGMVAQLLGLAWFMRFKDQSQRLTPAMRQAHAVVTAVAASLVLTIGLMDPVASKLVAPAVALLLVAGLFVLRWKALIPVLYQALATTALAWAWNPDISDVLLTAHSALLLAVVNLLFLGAGLMVLRARDEDSSGDVLARLITWPPLAMAWVLLLEASVMSGSNLGVAGLLTLVAAGTFLLSALILRRTWLFGAAFLGLAAGVHGLAASGSSDPITALSRASQVLMVVFTALALGLEGRDKGLVRRLRVAARLGFVVCAQVGLVWLAAALALGTGFAVQAFHLVLLAGLLIAEELRVANRVGATNAVAVAEGWPRWRLEVALALTFIWVPVQAAALGSSTWWTLAAAGWLVFAVALRVAARVLGRWGRRGSTERLHAAAMTCGIAAGAASLVAALDTGGSPWLQLMPGFLASALFVFMTFDRPTERRPEGALTDHRSEGGAKHHLHSALLAMGLFAASSAALLLRLETWGPELHCLGPGLALLGLSGLLRRELDERWRQRLFTAGATLLYAMPVLGLLDELSWGWQIVLLLLAVGFGAVSFRLRSRSLLIVSTAALVIDLACFLIKLKQTAPFLVWVAGIVFGLGLMATAALLEHRREVLLQHIRIWGQELRSWA